MSTSKKHNQKKGGGKPGQLPPKMPRKISKKQSQKAAKGFFSNLVSAFLIILTIILLYSFVAEQNQNTEEIAISQLAQDIRAGAVSEIVVRGDNVEAIYNKDTENEQTKETQMRLQIEKGWPIFDASSK